MSKNNRAPLPTLRVGTGDYVLIAVHGDTMVTVGAGDCEANALAGSKLPVTEVVRCSAEDARLWSTSGLFMLLIRAETQDDCEWLHSLIESTLAVAKYL